MRHCTGFDREGEMGKGLLGRFRERMHSGNPPSPPAPAMGIPPAPAPLGQKGRGEPRPSTGGRGRRLPLLAARPPIQKGLPPSFRPRRASSPSHPHHCQQRIALHGLRHDLWDDHGKPGIAREFRAAPEKAADARGAGRRNPSGNGSRPDTPCAATEEAFEVPSPGPRGFLAVFLLPQQVDELPAEHRPFPLLRENAL